MTHVYQDLYELVEQRLQQHQMQMPCTKEAFLFAADTESGTCDGAKMKEMNNEAFFQSAYIGIMNRLPDDEAERNWRQNVRQQKTEEFREDLLETLIFSPEALAKNTVLINNQIVTTKEMDSEVLLELALHGKDTRIREAEKKGLIDYLYKAYLVLPLSFRKWVRKVLKGK